VQTDDILVFCFALSALGGPEYREACGITAPLVEAAVLSPL